MRLVLGIETACDDTAAAVVDENMNVLSNSVWGQKQTHAAFRGVVPELAARRHAEVVFRVINEALSKANVSFDDISAVAVNNQHGLVRSVTVGVSAARALAFARALPLIPVHHVEAHIFSAIMSHEELSQPHICLAVAGGHNALILVREVGNYEVVGKTLDDSAGEAFDKVGSYLGLPFPAGGEVDKLARNGDATAFNLPRPIIKDGSLDFSFSGLKTPVRKAAENLEAHGSAADLAASFERAVVEVLAYKTLSAAKQFGISLVSVVGGVARNTLLRTELTRIGQDAGVVVKFAPPELCTDNAAMVAGLAQHQISCGAESNFAIDATPNAPLGRKSALYRPQR